MAEFDFTSRKKRTLKVKVNNKLTLLLLPPTLTLFDKLSNMDVEDAGIGTLKSILLDIFNCNLGKKVSINDLAEFDIDSIKDFITVYYEFIEEVSHDPN